MPFLLVILAFLSITRQESETQFLKGAATCTGFTCENGGTLKPFDGECACACPETHSGLQCETELEESLWPAGPYATPMPIYGCPEKESKGWKEGYINMTFTEDVMDESLLREAKGQALLGPYGHRVIQINFCVKPILTKRSHTASVQWPGGTFGVYRVGGKCPEGFQHHNLTMEFPPLLRVNTDGYLPDMQVTEAAGSAVVQISICDRSDSAVHSGTHAINWNYPFILLQGGSNLTTDDGNCPKFSNIDVLPETLHVTSHVTRYVDGVIAAVGGVKYCLCKKGIMKPDDKLEEYFGKIYLHFPNGSSLQLSKEFLWIFTEQLLAINTLLTSAGYEGLYRDYPATRYGTDRWRFFERRGDFSSAKIPLAVFLRSAEIPWIMVDLEQEIRIEVVTLEALSYTSRTWLKAVDWTHEESPSVLFSRSRWAFLNHGAFQCGSNLKQKAASGNLKQECSRPISARYITVYGKGYYTASSKTVTFFMVLNNVIIKGGGSGCGKDLGLRDFAIEDFQLSASSSTEWRLPSQARPHLPGWCALLSDLEPYFQVDLLVATVVEGILVYNWATTIDTNARNVYSLKTFPTGVKSFWIEYGFRTDALKAYFTSPDNKTVARRILSVDPSLPFDRVQTFLLQEAVVASLIRLRPIGFHFDDFSATCLRFELVGCRKYRVKTLQCSDSATTFWTRRSEVYVSGESRYNAQTVNSTDYSDCIDRCNGCDAVEYRIDKRDCLTYNSSGLADFRRVASTAKSVTYQKTCLDEPVVLPPFTVTKRGMRTIGENFPRALVAHVLVESIITSLGYPFFYDTGVIANWNIDFTSGGHWRFSQIIFTNISLNKYQSPDWYTDEPCEDKVDLIGHNSIITGNELTDSTLDPLYLYLSQGRTHLLDNSLNGRQVAYLTWSTTVTLRFYTCLRESNFTFRGNGFRAIIKVKETASIQRHLCNKQLLFDFFVSISSDSFNGLQVAGDHVEIYCIKFRSLPINLTIEYLDLDCDGSSALEVADRYTFLHQFCNLNRPMASILSTREILTIRLYYTSSYQYHGLQGFRARYNKVLLPFVRNEPIWVQKATDSRVVLGQRVCTRAFGKCYAFFRNTFPVLFDNKSGYGLSAREAQAKCVESFGPSAGLASVRGRATATFFVRQLVVKDVFSPYQESGINVWGSIYNYIYIGLHWDTDADGRLKARWKDGSTVTFTAWSANQPVNRATNRCTRMAIFPWTVLETWESIDCNLIAAEYFVCETAMVDSDPALGNLHQQIEDVDITTYQGDIRRFLVCRGGEFVSRLYSCDGVKDCLDGTDEQQCENGAFVVSSNPTSTPTGEVIQSCKGSKFFWCANGDHCIPVSFTCDFVSDCADGSDEDCVFQDCSIGEYQCKNHQCIPQGSVCNVIKDCWDGSDEMNCETCGTATFQCSDRSCIPGQRRCDGFADCKDGVDENDCRRPSMGSCLDWWNRGYSETGVFRVNDTSVLCNFDLVATNRIVQTEYHNLQAKRNTAGQFILTYENQDFVSNLMKTLSCTQSLIQTCEPPADMIDEMEAKLGFRGQRHRPCLCLRLVWTDNVSYVEPCSNEEEDVLGEQWLMERAKVLERYRSRPLTVMEPVTSGVDNQWIKVEPIVCQEDAPADVPVLLCVRGNTVSRDVQCLYDVDEYGDVTGCRDLTHLQHCENFTCPAGFVKCPNSFCLAASLLCDGERQCPDGRDEIFCWCGHQDAFALIMFDGNDGLDDAAIRLAGQLYDNTTSMVPSNVGLVRYYPSSNSRIGRGNQSSAGTEMEFTTYMPRKVKQYSEKKTYTVAPGRAIVAEVLANTKPNIGALVLLQKGSKLSAAAMVDFNHSLTGNMRLYAVSIGGQADSPNSSYKSVFPPGTTFVHFTSADIVVPFPFGPQYCTDFSPDLSPVCPGMYRCHASRRCLPASSVCDGLRQCPLGDDEKLCDFNCPSNCSCSRYEVDCSSSRASVELLKNLPVNTKYLDLHANDFSSFVFGPSRLQFLIVLNMTQCLLRNVPALFLKSMRNLRVLDLSFNKLISIKTLDFVGKISLVQLDLTGNTELSILEPMSFSNLRNLRVVTITHTNIDSVLAHTFYNLNATHLNLSGNRISKFENHAFYRATVRNLDISNNPISDFQSSMFVGISSLKSLRTNAYKFCCIRPDSVTENNCYPARDEFSSCGDLIRDEGFRYILWIAGLCALVGNMLAVLYRILFNKDLLQIGYGIFVTNLAVSDLLMGVYILMVASVDVAFRGRYSMMGDWWKTSAWCRLAGVLATMSSEASVLFVCLISLDRVFVIKYPGGNYRFSPRLALVAATIVWTLVVVLATIPLSITNYFDDQFYSKTGFCLPLPLSRSRPFGLEFTTAVFVSFNVPVFLLVALGLLGIYRHVQGSDNNLMRETRSHRKHDLKFCRNILLMVTVNIACWSPFGIMGLMSLSGRRYGSRYDSSSIAVLTVLTFTLNSALNPFLYTVSTIIGSKAFVPYMKEQSERIVFHKGLVVRLLKLWDKEIITQPIGSKPGYRPLPRQLSCHSLTPRELLRVGLRLVQVLDQLHAANLVHGHLTLSSVCVRQYHEAIVGVMVKVSPRLAANKKEKKNDVHGLGTVIYELLRTLKA